MSGQFDVFHSLDKEKQERIIEAALDEFAKNGYPRASTSKIAQNAQIGKGMLFYYFGNKEQLFDFLCEYTIAFARDQYLQQYQFETGDFLIRCQKLIEIKHKVIQKWPRLVTFFERMYQDADTPYFSKYLAEVEALRHQLLENIYTGIDFSLFREDMDGQMVVQYIRWLFDAYQNDVKERITRGELKMETPGLAAEWQRFDDFEHDIRKLFYKEKK